MTHQPETTVTVDALARMLSAADVEINHGDYPTWDTLAKSGQKQYRQAARYLLKRLHITTPAAVSAAVAPPTGRAALRCVCGDPIEWRDYEDGSGWIHSPGSDTPCLDARPATDEIRAQLLHAIDHAYTTGVLGYTSPEDLLAAYDNSRTPATSRAAALERVRALHQPMQRGPFTICAHCSGWDGEWRCRGVMTDYPCPTISALPAAKPADRAALRERIAAAIYERNNPGYQWADAHPDDRLAYGFDADAVLAVLPEVADKAAVLHETADAVAQMRIGAEDPNPDDHVRGYNNALDHVEAELRRMADEGPLSPYYAHPECGFHWHGRDGMDIPMRDGQPVCPRCELAKVQKRLDYTQRRRDEVGVECKRRGRRVLEQSERIIALERQVDEVQRQLGAEILRAGQAEAELRRVADETATETPDAVDLPTLAAALDGLHTLIATSSRDWQTYRVDAWLWAVLCGWDCEQTEHDDTCVHGALEETAAMHGWDEATVAKARRYRAAVRAVTEALPAAGARQDGTET